LATGHWDNTVRVWNLITGKLLNRFVHGEDVSAVAFSPDGRYVALGCADNKVRLWDLQVTTERATCRGNVYGRIALAVAQNGMVATGGAKHTVKLWNPKTGEERELKGHRQHVVSVAFAPDGKTLASSSEDQTVKLWSVPDGRLLRTLSGHKGDVSAVAYSPDGTRLASGGDFGELRVWNLMNGDVQMLEGCRGAVLTVAFAPDGEMLVSGGGTLHGFGELKFWDLTTSAPVCIATLDQPSSVRCIAFSHDGRVLVAGCNTQDRSALWDVETRHVRFYIDGVDNLSGVAFCPDGKTLAIAFEKDIKLLHLATGQPVGEIVTNEQLEGIAFFPKGRTLVSASEEGTVRLWRAAPDEVEP